MRWIDQWKMQQDLRELYELLKKDRELRLTPGATTPELADHMVTGGHRIAVLRHRIKKMRKAAGMSEDFEEPDIPL